MGNAGSQSDFHVIFKVAIWRPRQFENHCDKEMRLLKTLLVC